MITIRGMMEILQMGKIDGPKSFKDFTQISIKNKMLSSATVSKRLDELISVGAIIEVVKRSKSGRRVVGYKTTEKGERIIGHARELHRALDTPIDKIGRV